MRSSPSGGDPSTALTLIISELDYVTYLMSYYPGHETLWCHRRFIAWILMRYHLGAAPVDHAGLNGVIANEIAYVRDAVADNDIENSQDHHRYVRRNSGLGKSVFAHQCVTLTARFASHCVLCADLD